MREEGAENVLSPELPYQELRNLLISWLKDPSDHDVRYWPDIERGLKESMRLEFVPDRIVVAKSFRLQARVVYKRIVDS